MASVFTYDPDPPRVSSPWIQLDDDSGHATPSTQSASTPRSHANPGMLSEYGVTRLHAEPQEGPTEYKLHLLLRPRRAYQSMSTAGGADSLPKSRSKDLIATKTTQLGTITSHQTRLQRLQHLTTQLLWRLQQSSPYHASSSKDLTVPRLPEDSLEMGTSILPGPLVPGLDESRGALYEIGVSDDGTLVGLTKDEMDESITTLRVMGASLGCTVDVLRMVIVGNCEWIEQGQTSGNGNSVLDEETRKERLWVAEALVMPSLAQTVDSRLASSNGAAGKNEDGSKTVDVPNRGSSTTPQLRVTLTGPSMSGKSSLLGTLSTGTLDNGRGKSRLSLLKHRHEMVSGVTSSIAQELVGYSDGDVLNFAHANIESWVDIHDRSEAGRLVFVSDSGGHPRYRRTVLRGLMNWAPHWSILCISADDRERSSSGSDESSSGPEMLGGAKTEVDFVKAHLTLSLRLAVPMAIVVTKLDLASKASLQKAMGKILTAIKEAGRIPKILQPDQSQQGGELTQVPAEDSAKVRAIVKLMATENGLTKYVPIVLTSTVKGTGMGLVHALLEGLPLPPTPTPRDFVGMALNPEQPKSLFHVDDIFNLPASYGSLTNSSSSAVQRGVIASGYLRFGSLSVGDDLVVGPFPAANEDPRGGSVPEDRPSPGGYGLSISHPSSAELARVAMKNAVSASSIAGEWHNARVVSVRNLRLPVRSLEAGQVGSIGLVFEGLPDAQDLPRVRRGMVLGRPSKHMLDTGLSLQAASGFAATFMDPAIDSLVVGSFVNVYVASVRAAAKILGITHHHAPVESNNGAPDWDDEIFSLNDDVEAQEEVKSVPRVTGAEVFLELLHSREWLEMGSTVMLLEGGSQDKSGLEGYVGKIIEIVD